jgi:hypothetical protein
MRRVAIRIKSTSWLGADSIAYVTNWFSVEHYHHSAYGGLRLVKLNVASSEEVTLKPKCQT